MKFGFRASTVSMIGAAAFAALTAAAPSALADPAVPPVPQPVPGPSAAAPAAVAAPAVPEPAPSAPLAAAAGDPAAVPLGVAPAAPAAGIALAAPAAGIALAAPAAGIALAAPAAGIALAAPAAEGVPHLASPDNLPPGTTGAPVATPGRLGYLRELWHAMRTQEVSGGDALLLFTQRPLTSGPQEARTPVPAAEAATAPATAP
ncbi:hypothetical protein [Mycolicibacterium parafortuitum]|uniref:Uncharacterized protein n=1 Tax=Mycolicibacterium parafortuitum TaxID=39692 RepID=A0A375YM53_MYCPF|nr:hypothetical protein [Mycolicibacterium parafortuitum]SRX82225.1 hypothetical protein MPP7335_03985 [Mycolicibacterium parafortuitum]